MNMRLFFLLVKGGTILLNNRGFTLLEVLVASSIVLMLITTILPISSLLEQERVVLSERRALASKLHDALQPFLWNDQHLPFNYSDKINEVDVTFYFVYEGDDVKGCVNWENARDKIETICLYGFRKR